MPIVIPGANNDYLSFVDGSGSVALTRLPHKRQRAGVVVTLLNFDGLTYPRAYWGENRDESWDVQYRVIGTDGDSWSALRALIEARTTLLWRDVHGNSTYCVVAGQEQEPMLPMPTPVTDLRFTLTRVTYP